MTQLQERVDQAWFEMTILLPASPDAFERHDSAALAEGCRDILERAIRADREWLLRQLLRSDYQLMEQIPGALDYLARM